MRGLPLSGLLAFVLGVSAFFLQALHTRGDSLAPSVLFACRALFAHIFLLSFIFPVWLLPLKPLFTCRSGRDGNFLACSFPRLCSQPAGRLPLFARPVLPEPARHALCVRSSVLFWLSVCQFYVVCTRIFLLSFAFSCLAVASQTSFHLSLMPRRGFPCLSPPAALFPACGSCHLLLFRRLFCPLPVCLFCVVYAGFLSLVFLPFPA